VFAGLMSGTFTAAFMETCFTAGTPLMETETTSKPIEEFRSYEDYGDDCDWILTRDQNDPEAPLLLRRVLHKFVRLGPVLTLRAGGRTIETTAEHPFWVVDRPAGDYEGREDRGWLAAGLLRAGDVLVSHARQQVVVEEVSQSARVTTVYNLEVEDCHTYFMGSQEWGWSVWAHNNYIADDKSIAGKSPSKIRGDLPKGWTVRKPASGKRGWVMVDETGQERLRYMAPDKNGKFDYQKKGYFRRNNAAGDFLDESGSLVPRDHPLFDQLTHIIPSG
jgi:Pretoxin HINT domain